MSRIILKNKKIVEISQEEKIKIINVLSHNISHGTYIIGDKDRLSAYLITISEIAAIT